MILIITGLLLMHDHNLIIKGNVKCIIEYINEVLKHKKCLLKGQMLKDGFSVRLRYARGHEMIPVLKYCIKQDGNAISIKGNARLHKLSYAVLIILNILPFLWGIVIVLYMLSKQCLEGASIIILLILLLAIIINVILRFSYIMNLKSTKYEVEKIFNKYIKGSL
jgi:hypothetical protein